MMDCLRRLVVDNRLSIYFQKYGEHLQQVAVEGVRRLKTVLDTNVYKATSLLSLTQKF
ncbi:hypothetical protein [Dulcicalothrix desertica]|uniref:hypothetical protein n=1 Tax=Dulcicalothrix desertica TaxID=32056 RepID=UPI0013155447|nr:hypothetical protein [Dulcicalothrix desertica]